MSNLNLDWGTSPEYVELEKDDVHVWRVNLNLTTESIRRLSRFFTPDEVARMNRFYFPKDQARFAVARGALRTTLSRYTSISPEEIRFSYDTHGKPNLDLSQIGVAQPLHFNLSHSGDLALIGVASSRKIGVDIEEMKTNLDYTQLAKRFFTPSEQAALFRLPSELQIHTFYAIWTRKEAYLKATGTGLSMPLDGFEVNLDSEQKVVPVNRSQRSSSNEMWTLLELIPGPGYTAALAVAGQDWDLSCWQWV